MPAGEELAAPAPVGVGPDVRDGVRGKLVEQVLDVLAVHESTPVADGCCRAGQWFIPQSDPPVMRSFTCDGPDLPEASDAPCRTALDGFWPAPSGGQDPDES